MHIFGIRHHGPGSARSLRAALEGLAPDIVLIEGPPEAGAILPLALDQGMQPPVCLLVYVPDEPQRAVVYPFAEFSPEWQAIQYGLRQGVPVRFMDLPQQHWLAMKQDTSPPDVEPSAPRDPLDLLAQVAGVEDGERWWERVVEERGGDAQVFPAILEAMSALREKDARRPDSMEPVREAAMRTAIRKAQQEGYARIAVVCGAWHAPALLDLPPARADRDLLKGLPKVKVSVTWAPWSYGHLAFASGYGAGVLSPGWYEHLWATPPDHTAIYWLGRVAHLLREQDLDASAAQVIDAVRLAEALAALRERAHPGLAELNEAALAVFCFGDSLPLQLVRQKLIVGDRLGRVPSQAPIIPLQADLAAAQKRLYLPPKLEDKVYDLDLRQPTDLERSALLHRLAFLGIEWGKLQRARGAKGTFHEIWTLKWDPAFTVTLVGAARWGNTVGAAATALACYRAGTAASLAELTALLDVVLLADLPDAVAPVMAGIQAQMALSGDVIALMAALPPLARAMRYGAVRQTSGAAALDAAAFTSIVDGLAARICIGLPLACASLDDNAARAMLERVEGVQDSLAILQRPDLVQSWQDTLLRLADQAGMHNLIAGRCCRLLLDAGVFDFEQVTRRLGLALSPGADPVQAAAWLDGFLRGSGLLLLHDDALWAMLDRWVTGLASDKFVAVLPLLRRTFAAFAPPERRQIGERVTRGVRRSQVEGGLLVDEERANAALPVAAMLLGLKMGGSEAP